METPFAANCSLSPWSPRLFSRLCNSAAFRPSFRLYVVLLLIVKGAKSKTVADVGDVLDNTSPISRYSNRPRELVRSRIVPIIRETT